MTSKCGPNPVLWRQSRGNQKDYGGKDLW